VNGPLQRVEMARSSLLRPAKPPGSRFCNLHRRTDFKLGDAEVREFAVDLSDIFSMG
jgi:hypothetical protein